MRSGGFPARLTRRRLATAAALLVALAAVPAALGFTGVEAVSTVNAIRAQYGLPAIPAAPFDSVDSDNWNLRQSDAPTMGEEIGGWPDLLAYVLDPRASALAARNAADGATLRVAVDATEPLSGPVLPKTVDPASPVGLALLLPSAPGQVRLWERRGASDVALATKVDRAAGAGGAELVAVDMPGDDGLRLGYGVSYRLELGSTTFSFETPALPAAYVKRTWTYTASMTPTARRLWKTATAAVPPLVRRILAQVDGAVAVSLRNCSNEAGDSCAAFDEQGVYTIWLSPDDLGDSDGGRFVALHEIGHIVDYLGLDKTGYAAFRALFARSPAWRSCFRNPVGSGCVPFVELFADQFAFYATGERSDPAGGYGDPPLASRADFGRVLAAQWAFRPPAWRNPAR